MGMPASRLTDMHVCPMVTVLVPHVGGPIVGPGAPTVLIGGLPAARVSDMAVCVGPPDVIALGSFTVLTMSMPQARIMDMTAHGGMIVLGMPTVLVGP
ncbi:MAG TPA: PAAR domain-containing protein [Verrucomicrobiae bacterium]|nr:PAAR domain-containing protein [Verrucomicrobiae bacterium]